MAVTLQRVAQVFWHEGATGIRRRVARRYRNVAFNVARRLNRPTFRSDYGIEMAANWGDTTFFFCSVGRYGEFLSSLIADQSTPFCFIDIGANQGLYTVLAAKNPACQRVYAFEPVLRTAELLARNITLNGVENRCHVVRKAISDSAGTVTFSLQEGHSGAASIDRSPGQGQQIEIEAVDGAGFAAILQDTDLPLLVKIDVEGHEAVVIDQILQTAVADRITAIFFECDERWMDVAVVQERLAAAGFRHSQKLGNGHHYDVLASRAETG